MATLAGLFCVSGMINVIAQAESLIIIQKIVPLPIISLLISIGMYTLNDLVDADLDKLNGKKRPIPSGLVSRSQAWGFIVWTNGLAILLSIITLNIISMILVVPMLIIGILYSTPKIALSDRFVIKTLSIAIFYILCAILGFTSTYGLNVAIANPGGLTYVAIMLGTMIFISSVFNDLGDVSGDRAAGRHTIPITIGQTKTIKMSMVLSTAMAIASGTVYLLGGIGLATALLVCLFSSFVTTKMAKTVKGFNDAEFMRKQHKKLFPLHLVLQSCLVAGTLLL